MEHTQAQSTHAVERYLLGEMTAAQREEFEDHFFNCAECGEGVRTGSLLMANGAVVARGGANPVVPSVPGRVVEMPARSGVRAAKSAGGGPGREWRRMAAAVAALLLVSVGVYQGQAGRESEAHLRLSDAVRGVAVAVTVVKAGQQAVVEAELAVLHPRESYAVELIGGGEPLILAKSAPLKNGVISALLPKTLAVGRYDVVVRETPGGKLTARYPLRVER